MIQEALLTLQEGAKFMFHAQDREAETTSLKQLDLVWVFDLYVMLRTWVEK